MPSSPPKTIELTDEEYTHLVVDLDLKLRKCNPLGYPSTNSTFLPLVTATMWNGIYKKLTNIDHPEFVRFKDCLRS